MINITEHKKERTGWNIEESIEIVRWLEPKLAEIGFHVGLTGGSLFKGESKKDLDLIIFPHQVGKPEQRPFDDAWKLLIELCHAEEDKVCHPGTQCRDSKDVRWIRTNGKRIDFFFLQ